MIGLGDPKREAAAPVGKIVDPRRLLLIGAVLDHQQQADVVANDGVFVLQVAMQPKALAGQVLADDCHAKVGAVLPAVLLREWVSVVAGSVGPSPGFAKKCLPPVVREPASLPVRSRIFASVIEESNVVVLLLERLDLPLDEVVELDQVVGQLLRQVEVHGAVPSVVSGGVTVLLSTAGSRSQVEHRPNSQDESAAGGRVAWEKVDDGRR